MRSTPKAKDKNQTTAGAGKLTTPESEIKPHGRLGEPGYDPEKDPNCVGMSLGTYSLDWVVKTVGKKSKDEITAYDFFADPETGLRPGEDKKPWGMGQGDLTNGIKHSVIPPLVIWKDGQWLSDAYWDDGFKAEELSQYYQNKLEKIDWPKDGKVPAEIFTHWIVSGEGTPGNNYYRLYILPESESKQTPPKHPLMWADALKSPAKTTSYGGGGGGYPAWKAAPAPKEPEKPKQPTLPAGVRMRCVGCGHWFKMNDLSGHMQVCPGQEASKDADWAMMCDERCGCRTLDEVAKCKPGFPRQKPEPVPAAEGEKVQAPDENGAKATAKTKGVTADGKKSPARVEKTPATP